MNYCESFCRTIQRLCNSGGGGLPDEYQQVEYLRATGTQYINTGVKTANGIGIKAVISCANNAENPMLCGASTTSSNRFFLWTFDAQLKIAYGYRDAYTRTNHTWAINTVYDIDATIGTSKITLKQIGAGGWTYEANVTTQFNGSIDLYLLATNVSGTSTGNKLSGKLYSASMYNSGRKIRDFIPCYRLSDSKPGLYDLVSNTFYTNAGTGEFTVGQDV